MSQHPLLELAHSAEVRRATGFRSVAEGLNGEKIAELHEAEIQGAPRRGEVGRKYFPKRSAKPPTERRTNKDAEHLEMALVKHSAGGGSLELPDDAGSLQFLDYQVALREPRKSGDTSPDPHKQVGKVDLLGVKGDRLAVVEVRYLEPEATRCGTGDTPLRVMLEALAKHAIVVANQAALQAEVLETFGRTVSDEKPCLVILASPRYWKLCRKREAQKGAAWINQLERLAKETQESLGIDVHLLGLELRGDPGWEYAEDGPSLTGEPSAADSWEPGAGRVRPKPKPRPKAQPEEDVIVEPDMTRPVRSYVFAESYQAGDRIDHPKLGLGVVQGPAGHGKIEVLFDGKRSLLVHERQPAASV